MGVCPSVCGVLQSTPRLSSAVVGYPHDLRICLIGALNKMTLTMISSCGDMQNKWIPNKGGWPEEISENSRIELLFRDGETEVSGKDILKYDWKLLGLYSDIVAWREME